MALAVQLAIGKARLGTSLKDWAPSPRIGHFVILEIMTRNWALPERRQHDWQLQEPLQTINVTQETPQGGWLYQQRCIKTSSGGKKFKAKKHIIHLLTSDFHHCTASACFIPVVFF
jgi:hypothetical protein